MVNALALDTAGSPVTNGMLWAMEKKQLLEKITHLEKRLGDAERSCSKLEEEKKGLWRLVHYWGDRHGHIQDRLLDAVENKGRLEKEAIRMDMKLKEKRLKITELRERIVEAGCITVVRNLTFPHRSQD